MGLLNISKKNAERLKRLLNVDTEKRSDGLTGRFVKFVNETNATLEKGTPVSITSFLSSDYDKCAAFLRTQIPICKGAVSSKAAGYSDALIRPLQVGKINIDGGFRVTRCDSTDEESTVGANWFYANEDLELIASSSGAVYKVLCKSSISNHKRVCLLVALSSSASGESGGGGGGATSEITFISEVTVNQTGDLVFTKTTTDVMVP